MKLEVCSATLPSPEASMIKNLFPATLLLSGRVSISVKKPKVEEL